MADDERDDEDERNRLRLEKRDYLALAIAALETVFLPLVILIAILLAFLVILR